MYKNKLRPAVFLTWLVSLVGHPTLLSAKEFVLAEKGQSKVVLLAPGENVWPGRRLADRIKKLTGADLQVTTDAQTLASDGNLILVGTPESNPAISELHGIEATASNLGEEGYILKNDLWNGREVLIAGGKTLAGVNNAVSELVSWKLKLSKGGASIPSALNETDKPALKYRIVWTWDGHCMWAPTTKEMMEIYSPLTGSTVVPYTSEGFRTHFTRAIDYFSDHKLNGLIVWGFLRDEHGGVEMGREVSRYAKQNNVRILPGVCSQAAYGGFIFSANNKFTLDVWGKQHPELQGKNAKGEVTPGAICPSKPENQQWLREGAEWLFTNLPDIGGINLENGDFMTCHTEDCVAARADPANDPNCFCDMMTSQKPILEVAKTMRPDGWMTFAAYVGFTEATARSVSKTSVYPPKFVMQMPDNAICQWTYTSMVSPATWPKGSRPPESNFEDQIGLLHHGSVWGSPVDPKRWWAQPGAWADEYTSVMPFVCGRIFETGLGGLVITGQTGAQCPAHELNYLALEYFGWHPERTMEQFLKDRLAYCYGGEERARDFLRLLRETTRDVAKIREDRKTAADLAQAADLDIRQRARWQNLTDELDRRCQMLAAEEGKSEKPGTETIIKPHGAQDGFIDLAIDEVNTSGTMLKLGKQGGKGCVAIGIHSLPPGTLARDILEAKLHVPLTDTAWLQDTSASGLTFVIEHLDAAQGTRVTAPDGVSPALDRMGLYRSPGPLITDNTRSLELDVTGHVKEDLDAGRASFTWRIAPESLPDAIASQFYIPSVETNDPAFPEVNRGARLVLRVRYATQQ